jgi:hypothetical protein
MQNSTNGYFELTGNIVGVLGSAGISSMKIVYTYQDLLGDVKYEY